MSTVDIITVIDASTLIELVNNGKLSAGTLTQPTKLGSYKDADPFIFMIADGDYVINGQAQSELSISCKVGDTLRWTIANPSAGLTYNCMYYQFSSSDSLIFNYITSPQPHATLSNFYYSTSEQPSTALKTSFTCSPWEASVTAIPSEKLQYNWAFQIIDNLSGLALAYFVWDPFIQIQQDPPTPQNVVEVQLSNHTGIDASDLFVFIQSQSQIYQLQQNIAQAVVAPPLGAAPSAALSSLPKNTNGDYYFYLSSTQDLTAGRIYISDSNQAVNIKAGGAIAGPSPNASFNFDFIELTLTASAQTINLDTSEIDQFGMPICLQVLPQDPDFPSGTGIVLHDTRAQILAAFSTMTQAPAFASYAQCIQNKAANPPTTPHTVHRLLSPQNVLADTMQSTQLTGSISAAQGTSGSYSATFTATSGIGQVAAGWVVVGAGVAGGASVKACSASSITLQNAHAPFTNLSSATLSFYPASNCGLQQVFDEAIFSLFNYYAAGADKPNTLYLVGNGTTSGMEIYSGQVIDDYQLPAGMTDINGNTGTQYTVFQFVGTGLCYNGADATLQPSTQQAGATYQIFYPYFSTNCTYLPNTTILAPPPPCWWKPGYGATMNPPAGDLNLVASASQMVFACNGVFADQIYQQFAYANTTTPLQDPSALANLANQLVTWLNRGIAPATCSSSNLHMRIGYFAATDIAPLDPANVQKHTASDLTPILFGATTSFNLTPPTGTIIDVPSIAGKLSWGTNDSDSVHFALAYCTSGNYWYPVFTGLTAATGDTIPQNSNQSLALQLKNQNQGQSSGNLIPAKGQPTQIQINWSTAVGLGSVTGTLSFNCSSQLSNHYATLHLLSPYGQANNPYNAGDLGPATNLTNNLKAGMQMTSLAAFSQPMSVYYVDSTQIILYSPIPLSPFNTGILSFGEFYPMCNGYPKGSWNAYAYFFHQAGGACIDGRGYAFPFDDNGGYSSDLNVNFGSTNPKAVISMNLLAWE